MLKVKPHFVLTARTEIERKLKLNEDKAAQEKAKQNRLLVRMLKKQEKTDAAAARMQAKLAKVPSNKKSKKKDEKKAKVTDPELVEPSIKKANFAKKPSIKDAKKKAEVAVAEEEYVLKKEPNINQKKQSLRLKLQTIEKLKKACLLLKKKLPGKI